MTDERSINDVYSVVLDTKGEVLGLREDFTDLKGHVNDQLELMNIRIEQKVDKTELLTSLGFKLFNNKAVRWTAGVILTATVSTVAVKQWLGPVGIDLIEKVVSFLS